MRVLWCLIWALLGSTGVFAQSQPLIQAPQLTEAQLASLGTPVLQSSPSTFDASIFARVPKQPPLSAQKSGFDRQRLLDVIGRIEGGHRGYDAVQMGARIKPKDRPTRMTVREIYAWIEATPRQPHAIGRYQFIPKTLRRLVKKLDIPTEEQFTPALQDRLAMELMREAGLARYEAGELSQEAFMHRLSKVWAALPSKSGRSYYHGIAGNKAVITWAEFAESFEASDLGSTVSRLKSSLPELALPSSQNPLPVRPNF